MSENDACADLSVNDNDRRAPPTNSRCIGAGKARPELSSKETDAEPPRGIHSANCFDVAAAVVEDFSEDKDKTLPGLLYLTTKGLGAKYLFSLRYDLRCFGFGCFTNSK